MCGITGYWSHQPLQPTAKNTIYNMVETLYHRGPDGYGYHFDQEHGLAMGHARLSIIDLETGDQPLFNRDRSLALTVNGEFYDYKRIRTGLRLEGFHFITKSDSEIALPLYEKFGLGFVERLRGEFAFALFDQRKQRLLLVRDRFGIKPLFYHVGKNAVVYGSEIKALFAHPEVPRQFSKEGVLHQMMHTMVPGTSAFEGVHAVLPGHFLMIEKTKLGFEVRQQRYWDMDFPHDGEHDASPPEQHIENVKQSLTDAVAFRLEADVPVGCYLSGGIDSCSMLGLASSMQQSPVQAFTISFDHAAYDESAIAREMANATGAEQEEIKLAADELYGDNFIKTAWHAERTFYNTLGVAKWCMSKRVNECDYRVVVTGEGSDELFGGYPAFKRDMFLHGMAGDGTKHLGAMDESNKLFKGAILSEDQVSHPALDAVCGFTPSWIQSWIQTLAIARPLLHDDLLAELKGYDPIEAIAGSFDPGQLDKRHPLDKAQYTWIKTMLECQILNWGGDRVDMANSMESRPAFLDHHVADVAKAIPPDLRIRGNTEKWVLREAMKHILPEVLYKREKFAFMAPPAHTSDSKGRAVHQLIDRFLNMDSVKKAGLFDPARLQQFLQDYQTDQDPVSLVRKDALLNHLLVLHILNEQFVQVERKEMGNLVREEVLA